MKKNLNVGIIGTKFMGKAHSNAWLNASKFFDLPMKPVLKAVSARNAEETAAFAENWGYEIVETDWRKVVENKDVDIVDICVPTNMHKEVALAAAANGKHIFCEKPCALTYADCVEMAEAADKAGVVHYLNHNYRRTPAVAFAKKMIDDGQLGRIYHWRGAYLQDWIMDPEFPLTWHLNKEICGAGPHFDLNSHAVDLAQHLIGDIQSVSAIMKTFIEERNIPGAGARTFASGTEKSSAKGKVEVDDASFMLCEFESGAMGAIDASRFAGGRKNYNYFEIYGSKGSIAFNLEDMNRLEFCDLTGDPDQAGFRSIQVTNGSHPYMSAWWAPGHIIGYEHAFSHAVRDFVEAIAAGTAISPNLWDGAKIMRVLQAATLSNADGRKVAVSEIK